MYSYSQYQTHRSRPYAYASEEDYYYPPRDIDYHHQYTYTDSPHIRKRKNLRRSRSFSRMDDDHYRFVNDNAYYHENRLDRVRSVSPPFTGRHYHHKSINRNMYNEGANNSRRPQLPCFVNLNQPMINPMTTNYCMPQSLGTSCPTATATPNTFVPQNNNDFFFIPQNVPMIQPYFMNQSNNSNPFLSSYYHHQPIFPTFMPMPSLHPDIVLPQAIAPEVVISSPSKEVPPVIETETTIETTDNVPEQQQQEEAPPAPPGPPLVMLRRKRSIMEEILSSFALLGDGVDYALPQAASNPQKTDSHPVDDSKAEEGTRDQPLYTSLREALDYGDKKPSSLSRKTSLKLYKKANALQNRQYIWCYRPFIEPKPSTDETNHEEASNALWAAFDMTNQVKLDYHYSFIMTHNQKNHNGDNAKPKIAVVENNLPDIITDDPSLILLLHRQSTIPNPVMISFGDGKAWYYTMQGENEPECHMLEITCLPTHDRRLVVSNDLLQEEQSKPLRRSKSMDVLASKFLNTVFGW